MKKSKCWLILHALALLTLMAAYKQADPLPKSCLTSVARGFIPDWLSIIPVCLYLFLLLGMLRRTP